jgi:hypothetical protein
MTRQMLRHPSREVHGDVPLHQDASHPELKQQCFQHEAQGTHAVVYTIVRNSTEGDTT